MSMYTDLVSQIAALLRSNPKQHLWLVQSAQNKDLVSHLKRYGLHGFDETYALTVTLNAIEIVLIEQMGV